MSYMAPAVITPQVAETYIQKACHTIDTAKQKFDEAANVYGHIAFAHEAEFAKQIIQRSYSGKPNKDAYSLIACTQDSIYNAVAQVADIGLSLNPKLEHAYLLPRRNTTSGNLECTLEPSYRGLVHLATEGGSIKNVSAGVVYKQDMASGAFKYKGPNAEPEFNDLNPFDEHPDTDITGAFCTAFLESGGVITTTISRADILQAKSMAGANSPAWSKWYAQMAIKVCIRRAYKLWPQPKKDDRFIKAIDILNQVDRSGTYHEKDEQPPFKVVGGTEMPQPSGEIMSLEDLTKLL